MLLLCGQGTLVTNQVNNDVNINFIYAQSVFSVRLFHNRTPREKNAEKKIGKSRETSERIGKKRIISEKMETKGTKSDAAIAQAVFITKG